MRLVVALLVVALASPAFAGSKPNKPRLGARVTPRMAFLPADVLATAELVGGDDLEDFHCPGVEWDWGDGARSFHEADCAPFETGMTLDRFFSARHVFRRGGEYHVKVTLRRGGRTVATANTTVMVHHRMVALP
jgi:hypothetical protein